MSGMKKMLCLLGALCLMFAACKEEQKAAPRIVKSKGLPSELLLVVDKAVWESTVADTLKQVLEGPIPALPQLESHFRVTRIFSPYYTQTYTTFHSKLFVKLDAQAAKPILGVSYDVIAKPQVEVTVKAANVKDLAEFIGRNQVYIRDVIADAQLEMRVAQLKQKYSQKAHSELKAVMGRTIFAPEEIRAAKRGNNFLWAGSNLNEKDLNVVVYTYPWDGKDVLQPLYFAAVRDSVMQANIPGSQPDQWMETVREDGLPLLASRLRKLNGGVVQEVRGLWQMRNGALGGPFVSLARIDTAANEVLVAEGFVYSPSTEKRDLLRRVEAAIRTVK